MESDEEWVVLCPDNPADSSDDDRGVLALPASCFSSTSSEDEDEDGGGGDDDDVDDDEEIGGGEDEEDPYGVDEDDDQPRPPPPRPISGMFHHTPSGSPAYFAFDPLRTAKQLIPDPAFAVLPEPATVLASSCGLVCLRGDATGFYYVANPVTFQRVRLPYPTRDHARDAAPAAVIAFDSDSPSLDAFHHDAFRFSHYHVVVAYQVADGVCAFETFSSRTWDWRVAGDVCAPETVVAASGVGALGRAFWRTTIGHILCFDPCSGRADLIPAPEEVESRPLWEIGEMEGSFCVTCMDEGVTEVVALYMVPDPRGGEPAWVWAGQFDGQNMLRQHEEMQLLRSQGAAEVVMWDPREELVIAMDFDGKATRTIGPLHGAKYGKYHTDFIPYVNSRTEIYNSDDVGSVFKTNDEAVTFRVPQPSVEAY